FSRASVCAEVIEVRTGTCGLVFVITGRGIRAIEERTPERRIAFIEVALLTVGIRIVASREDCRVRRERLQKSSSRRGVSVSRAPADVSCACEDPRSQLVPTG